MMLTLHVNRKRELGKRDPMLYGQFIEHFHRQIYGGVYDPGNPLSDADGLRTDVLEAMRRIGVPVLRWPGGCFVSSYHWKDAVGPVRKPAFDKAWRVEDPNTFGTDEYIRLCRKLGCEPYICTNAGTGAAEEMSDWLEYCNLENEGQYAKARIANGFPAPHRVKYWSIGNENYGPWEIGAKTAEEWGRLVLEAAKMMKHVDPTVELSAAAVPDLDWMFRLLQLCGSRLDWISLHQYWDALTEQDNPADYEACMAFTANLGSQVDRVRGILKALGLERRIRIAFDEWNLRSWHHPKVHSQELGVEKESYLAPRDLNDRNSTYTMADAVFSACFLNEMHRNCDLVKMANFAPVLNTRGCIYSWEGGVVLRSTYQVFDLYVHHLGDTVVDLWAEGEAPRWQVRRKDGGPAEVEALDLLATGWSNREGIALAAVNKHADQPQEIFLDPASAGRAFTVFTVNGPSKDSYNDVGRTEISVRKSAEGVCRAGEALVLEPHSVNVIEIA